MHKLKLAECFLRRWVWAEGSERTPKLFSGGRRTLPRARAGGGRHPLTWLGQRGLIYALCFGLLGTFAAVAQLRQFDVFLGYDSIVPEGNWFPVTCEVANDGPGFMAVFELTPAQFRQGQVQTLRLELPTGTRKRFVLPVFGSSQYNVAYNATLYDSKGYKRARLENLTPRRVANAGATILGGISRSVAGLPTFPKVNDRSQRRQPAAARIQPEQLPDNPLTLEGMQALYLNTEKAMSLSPAQANALLAWVSQGGHLIVGIEQPGDLQGCPWLARLLPFAPESMTSLRDASALPKWVREPSTRVLAADRAGTNYINIATRHAGFSSQKIPALPAAGEFTVCAGKLKQGRVVLADDGVPLIVTAQQACGQVTVLTFSPEREPLRFWEGRTFFWARLLDLPPEWFSTEKTQAHDNYGGWFIDAAFGALVDSKQIRKLPVGWLLLLLLVYLAVIGPVDQYWLKKINRQMLTWLTFPAYVIFFSLLIYLIGYKLRAGDSEWNELQVVDVHSTGAGAALRGRTYASVYSPANETYPVESTLAFAALRGEHGGMYGSQQSSQAKVDQRGNNFAAEVTVPVWTSQLYVGDWWQSLAAAPLSATIVAQDNGYEVTLANSLSYKLSDIRLAVGRHLFNLGDLPANGRRVVTVKSNVGRPLSSEAQGANQELQRAANSRRHALGDSSDARVTNPPHAAMLAGFLKLADDPNRYQNFQAPAGFDLSTQLSRGNAVVLAWADGRAFVPPLNRFAPRRSHNDSLFRLVVPVK